MNGEIEKSWQEILSLEFQQAYFSQLSKKIFSTYKNNSVYPPVAQIFEALNRTPFPNVRVVILGQDPYHGIGQAHGLAFSVPDGLPIPPSLRNMYKELANDVGIPTPTSGNLTRWAEQGVLLLNTTLTVAAGQPGSHQGLGWEQFTDAVITKIATEKTSVVFLLWGAHAQSKRHLIDETKHLVLTAPHPSPLSAHRGFLGCKHFSQTNLYLKEHNQQTIIW